MDASHIIALVSAVLSSTVAIVVAAVVPRRAFHFALRQEKARWAREQRSQLYVDLVTEAYAEKQSLYEEIMDPKIRESFPREREDLRLPPLERAQLGARATMFASKNVNVMFNRMQGIALRAMMPPPSNETERKAIRYEVDKAFDDLQEAIRVEADMHDDQL